MSVSLLRYGLSVFVIVTSLALGACLADLGVPPDLGVHTEEIVDGVRENGRPEVVFLYRTDGAACTGAFIAPYLVLTADHCVATRGGAAASASFFRVYVGSSTRQFTAEYRVAEVLQVDNPGLGRDRANDLALLVLTEPARETPLELGRASPYTLINQTITAVGFGQTPSGGSGTKYTTDALVTGYDGGFIFVEPAVCSGDSGGPMIGTDGLVYGVASFIFSPDGRTQPECGTAPGAYNEIARHLEFIDAALEATGVCVPTSEVELCNGRDDNCSGVIDEGCIPLGESCERDDECFGGRCADTPIGRVCAQECDGLRPALGCGLGFYCASNGCGGDCVPGEAGAGNFGEGCSADTDCASLFCADPGDGTPRCLEPCQRGAGQCLAGEVCVASGEGCGACFDESRVRNSRALGEACENNDACESGLCLLRAGISECTAECAGADDCPDHFECRSGYCTRDRRQGTGGVCENNEDCGEAGVCASQGERDWCTAQCGSAADCPRGFDCVDAGGASVCAPEAGLVGESCEVAEDCTSGLCADLPGGRRACTLECGSDRPCAVGFECRRTSDGRTAVCVAPVREGSSDGGCAAGIDGGGSRSTLGLILLIIGFAFWRRRPRG